MLIGTIDFYHFMLFSLILILPGDHKVKSKPLHFIISHTFQLIGVEFDLILRQFKLNILIPLLSEVQ